MNYFGPLPDVYVKARPLHDDWPWPLSLIPRRWTGLGCAMPPRQLLGNAPERFIQIKPGYPLAPIKTVLLGGSGISTSMINPTCAVGPDPVPPLGCWTLQAIYIRALHIWLPCYFAFSAKVLGRRLFFGGFFKPDVTTADWFWWAEFSLTWTKIK